MGENRRPVRHTSGGSKGMVVGGLAVEEPGAEMVSTISADNSEDVRGQEFTRGSDVGNNALPPEREGGGVSGDRFHRGCLEGICGSGKLLAKSEHGSTWRVTWFQGQEGNRDIKLGVKVGATVGGAHT